MERNKRETVTMDGLMGYHDLFGEEAMREIRAVKLRGLGRLPGDYYTFFEYYCVDPSCDCRRVAVRVFAQRSREPVAMISHAFEPPDADAPVPEQTFLDPGFPQAEYADELMAAFEGFLQEREYRAQLEYHYQRVKAAVRDRAHPVHREIAKIAGPAERPRLKVIPSDPYAPCPCGSGKKYKFCCRDRDREEQAAQAAAPTAWETVDDEDDDDEVVVADEAQFEKGRRLDAEGQRLMEKGEFAAAARLFRQSLAAFPLLAAPYNNLALCEYMQGDIDEAIRVTGQGLKTQPDNVFALGALIHFRLVRGPVAEAEQLGRRLKGLRPPEESALNKKCEALARLGWHEEVLAAVRQLKGLPGPETAYYVGLAAANLGRWPDAERYLNHACGSAARRPDAMRYLELIAKRRAPDNLRGAWPYFTAPEWICEPVIKRFGNGKKLQVEQWPGLVRFAEAMLDETPSRWEDGIKLLTLCGSDEAAATLQAMAESVFGPDEMRLAAMGALQQLGRAPDRMRYWSDNEWKEIETRSYEIVGEPTSPVPERALKLHLEAEALHRDSRWPEAERIWRRIIERAPDHLPAHHNLAACLANQGRVEPAKAILRKLMAEHPEYNFPFITMAMATADEDPDAAMELLKKVRLPQRVHLSEMVSYMVAQARVCLNRGEYEAAERAWRGARQLAPQHPGVRQLKEHFSGGVLTNLAHGIRHMSALFNRRATNERRRLLSAECPLEEAYAVFSKDELVQIAKRAGLAKSYRLAKEELLPTVCRALREPGRVCRLLTGLDEPTRVALRALAHCERGEMDFAEYTREHEPPDDEKRPRVREELRRRGLAFAGMRGGRCVMMIPPELVGEIRRMDERQ